jgi:hypothetical protein
VDLAYIISTYRYPEQLIRLVDRLNTPHASFYVHVDKKTDDAMFAEMKRGLSSLSNLDFLPRHRCEWGGFGHVAATLEGIRAITEGRRHGDYVILLTAQDYPIKTNEHISDYLAARDGRLFMEYFALPDGGWTNGGLDRYQAWHWRLRGRHVTLSPRSLGGRPRSLPGGLQAYGGSSYWCLSRESIEYVHRFVVEHPAFVRFFRYVDVPDELFFQTIVLNSVFRESVVNDNLRYIEWNDPDSGSPAVLVSSRMPQLAGSEALFARKFDSTVDARVLDAIDRQFLGVRPGA